MISPAQIIEETRMHGKLVMQADATGRPYTIDSLDKRQADNNVLIELRERAAGKGPAHEGSSDEVAAVKWLEDQREDIKGQVIGIPHGSLPVWDWTRLSPVGVGSKTPIPFSTTNNLRHCKKDRNRSLDKGGYMHHVSE